uniref:Uncharacterized protein n=1 Tax=Cajanus cajan TaxID=3821 RepID=A0A151S8X6_CAJCA|nr:hypothetical protein KK1_026900 [Cajanus cajan]
MDETKFLLELKFVSSFCLHKFVNLLCEETASFLSVFSSDPLFSCVVTFCTLVFLYLPHFFLKIVLSPVLILTTVLLLSILRLGPVEETTSLEQLTQWVHSETEVISEMGFESSSCFVEWDVKAPLEVIYEEYGEGEDVGDDANENVGIVRYPSLSRFYPESDSDSESSENGFSAIGDWDSPEEVGFRWDEEEEREGLYEIALDGCKRKRGLEFHFEEENLIEIDISPSRFRDLSGDDEVFSGEISCN